MEVKYWKKLLKSLQLLVVDWERKSWAEAVISGFILFLTNLFIYFWLPWVFIAAHGLSLAVASGGFPSRGAQALGTPPSVAVARGLNGCGSRALERGP